MTTSDFFYAIEWLIYLALIFALVVTLRGVRRELKRIADGLEEPRKKPE